MVTMLEWQAFDCISQGRKGEISERKRSMYWPLGCWLNHQRGQQRDQSLVYTAFDVHDHYYFVLEWNSGTGSKVLPTVELSHWPVLSLSLFFLFVYLLICLLIHSKVSNRDLVNFLHLLKMSLPLRLPDFLPY